MKQFVKRNSSTILSVGAGAGVVSTAYFAARAGHRHARKMADKDPYMTWQEEASHVWKLYIPAGAAGAITIVCLAGVKRIDGKKTLAAQAAFAVSQRAFESYREEVVGELGSRKDQEFLGKAAEKRMRDIPVPAIIAGDGEVLCCELFTGRYFKSSMTQLISAINTINEKLLKHDYATLDDLYYILGLEYTSTSGQIGWQAGKLLALEFSSILHDGKPVLAFDYNYTKTF